MIDESKIVVLGSLSLRVSQTSRTTATTNDVLRAMSLRSSQTTRTNAASDSVLNGASIPIAGYEHNKGTWGNPTKFDYTVINV